MFPTLVTMDPPTPAPDPDPDPETPDDDDDDDSILTYFSGSALSCPDYITMTPTLVTMDPPTPAPDPAPDPDTPEDDDDSILTYFSGSAISCIDFDDPDVYSAWRNTQTLILPFTLELDEALPEEALSHGAHGSLLYLPAAATATPLSSKGLLTSNEIPASDAFPLLDPPPDTTHDARPVAKPPPCSPPMLPFTGAVTPPSTLLLTNKPASVDPPPDTIHDARPDAKPPPFLPPRLPLTGAVTPQSTLSLTNKPTSVDPTPDHTPTARPAAKPPHAPASTWLSLWCLQTLPVPLKFPLDFVQ
jgi:hypothetical protein